MILSSSDYIVIGPIGRRHDYTTFYKTKDLGIWVKCGCFNDSIDDFFEKVKETHGTSKYAKEYFVAIELAKVKLEI